jgi:hypothetical protein
MVVQVTSTKIAAAASKAMARRAGRGRSASALQVTQFERKSDHPSSTAVSSTSNPQTLQQTPAKIKMQSQSKSLYHQQSVVHRGAVGGAVSIDEYLGNLLDGFCDGSCETKRSNKGGPPSSSGQEPGANLDAKTIANMLMLRKELLLLHQLLDTLY